MVSAFGSKAHRRPRVCDGLCGVTKWRLCHRISPGDVILEDGLVGESCQRCLAIGEPRRVLFLPQMGLGTPCEYSGIAGLDCDRPRVVGDGLIVMADVDVYPA